MCHINNRICVYTIFAFFCLAILASSPVDADRIDSTDSLVLPLGAASGPGSDPGTQWRCDAPI